MWMGVGLCTLVWVDLHCLSECASCVWVLSCVWVWGAKFWDQAKCKAILIVSWIFDILASLNYSLYLQLRAYSSQQCVSVGLVCWEAWSLWARKTVLTWKKRMDMETRVMVDIPLMLGPVGLFKLMLDLFCSISINEAASLSWFYKIYPFGFNIGLGLEVYESISFKYGMIIDNTRLQCDTRLNYLHLYSWSQGYKKASTCVIILL